MYNPPSRMGNLGYLLRKRLYYIFFVEITRSRNVFYLKGFLHVTVIKYLMGQITLQEELYTPPFLSTTSKSPSTFNDPLLLTVIFVFDILFFFKLTYKMQFIAIKTMQTVYYY